MRLLLLEFFRGALRPKERSLFFPFLQGLARELGCPTLWLCFGGDVAHEPGAPAGETLFAKLPAADLRTLAVHLAALRPTHVLSNDRLSRAALSLLSARTPPPKRLVMPQLGVLPAPGAERAPFSVGGGTGDGFARCGWFLDWLGLQEPRLAERFLIGRAVPDYAAVMANASARTARCQIAIVSGSQCGYRRASAQSPGFRGVDLGELKAHRGCSFCCAATLPSLTPPGDDPLALIETQLRRILETAGATGRDKGVYGFYDCRAFARFDAVFRLVLRLGLPPSVFYFAPRIDDVLRARARVERTLPALARAGHEVRVLSMGVENFSRRENERFNKGLSLSQVDRFLALMRRWDRSWPGTFKPFKAGQAQVELGLILFTPWTTLADIRTNLDRAAERGFPDRGYWLYATLIIEPMMPLHRLAQAHGGILAARFPDPGQVYGLFKNEGEFLKAVPWRFRDRRVADYFALLVRVCAAEREGDACPFFRGDPLFAAAAALYRRTNRRAATSPLQFARALLGLMEQRRAPRSRTGLLREALARAASAGDGRPAASRLARA
ncbi:MAG: hypothetical protein PHU21_13965, partial [Elusimicrobia bacterium]|nr:hypothetical protein [Elusimicrobiota bacterium]